MPELSLNVAQSIAGLPAALAGASVVLNAFGSQENPMEIPWKFHGNPMKSHEISIQIRLSQTRHDKGHTSRTLPITRRSGKTTRSEWPASYKKTVEEWLVRSDGPPSAASAASAAASQRAEPDVEAEASRDAVADMLRR